MWLRLKTRFWREWNCHQQDLFGWLEAAVGLLEFIDMNTVNLVAGMMGPKWGPIFAKSLQIGMGARIAWVGYRHRTGRIP